MAGTQIVLQDDEKYETYETLSHLYLILWKQLDLVVGDSKWLELASTNPDELRQDAQVALENLRPLIKDGDSWRIVVADFDRAQQFSAHSGTPKPEIESLKNDLRDKALRYAEESLLP